MKIIRRIASGVAAVLASIFIAAMLASVLLGWWSGCDAGERSVIVWVHGVVPVHACESR